MLSSEHELNILEQIYQTKGSIKQRDLAQIIGLSLGMTNSIIKRLVTKGWLKIKKVNNRNIQYIVSSDGLKEITRRSYRYLRRTIKNVVYFKETIAHFVTDIAHSDFVGIILVGKSDLDFILEHFTDQYKLDFKKILFTEEIHPYMEQISKHFVLFSEAVAEEEISLTIPNSAFLRKILLAS